MSPIVSRPISLNRSAVLGPTPRIFRTENGVRNSTMWSGRTTVSPSGFSKSEAIFAAAFVGAMPTEQESLLLPDRGLDIQGEFPSPVVVAPTAGRHIKVALLDPGGLEVVGEPPQEFHDLAAHAAIEFEVRGDEDGVGAQEDRLDARHRRPHAKFSRFVARGEDDASGMLSRIGSDNDRLPFEFRILANLQGGVEGVHVHMEQESGHRSRGHPLPQLRPTAKSLRRDPAETTESKSEETPGGVVQEA